MLFLAAVVAAVAGVGTFLEIKHYRLERQNWRVGDLEPTLIWTVVLLTASSIVVLTLR